MSTRVVTGKVRLSYVHVFEPKPVTDPNDKPKFSVLLLIPKIDPATYDKLKAAEEAAKEVAKVKKWGGRIPKLKPSPIHDGDVESDLERNPEHADHWTLNVSATARYIGDRLDPRSAPGIVGPDLQPILDPSEVYSGCYARVQISAAGYDWNGSKGVGFYLNNIQKIADGEPLGAVKMSAAEAFADDFI